MRLSTSTLLAGAALVAVCCIGGQAQPHQAQPHQAQTKPAPKNEAAKTSSVQLGDKVIVIPDPAGYEEAGAPFPRIKELFAATEAPSNDMLLAYLPAGDCTVLRSGGQIVFHHYAKVSVLKAARELAFSEADMAGTVAELRKNGTKMLEPDGPILSDVMKNAERGLSKLESREIGLNVSETQNLGEFDVRPDVYSVMLLIMLRVDSQGKQETMPMLATMNILKVRQRLVYVNAYHKISSLAAMKTELKPGIAEVKQFTTKWVNEILAANQ